MNEGALARINADELLDRISSGEIMRTIAAEYGVKKQSLRERLMKHPKYAEAIQDQAESIVEAATEECMRCEPDMPVIARARLRLEAAHKWAAARDPAKWGQKGNTVNIINGVNVDDALSAVTNKILDKLCVVSIQDAQESELSTASTVQIAQEIGK